jgi:hypothetical protein
MSTQAIIVIVALVALVALLAARAGGGPRVTQIDRTIRKEKDDRGNFGDA